MSFFMRDLPVQMKGSPPGTGGNPGGERSVQVGDRGYAPTRPL
jgi:hypothetical protein